MSDFHRPRRIEDQYRYALDNLMRSWLHLPRTTDLDSILAYLNNGGGVAVTEAAQRVARGMVTALAVQNAQSWREAAEKSTQGKRIFDLLRTEMDGPVGIVMRGMVARHALLIRTMPQNIAQDIASQIATRQMRGERAETIAANIYERIPEITASRIAMLARTEVGSTATAISRARSENLGLPCYEWLSSVDVRVRPSHRKMDHVIVLWSDPPAPEMLAHFGKPYQSSKGRLGGGLGLFLVVNVIRKLGGNVTAANAADTGAIVTLSLPLSALSLEYRNGERPFPA